VDHPNPTPVARAFAQAGPELGFGGPEWDFNGGQQEDGTGLYQYTLTRDGKRASTAVAFLNPVRDRANLTVQTGAQATRVLIDSGRAVGVEYLQNGEPGRVRAAREVILCAGTFDSPKLLMLSGIGPAEQLRSHGIPVVADLPGVGQNLQDHLLLPVWYRSKQELPTPAFIAEAGLFTRTRGGMSAAAPDLQFHFSAGKREFILPEYPFTGPSFAFVPIVVRPESRGAVSLRSSNPLDLAVVHGNYLQCDTDLQVFLRGIALSREIAATRAFAEFNGGEVSPGVRKSEPEMRDYIRTYCRTVWHVAGTCKMGRDALAVVDPQLRTFGVEGLRIADASIMPDITSGNTNAACIMIGEKVAEMILSRS
jgi:choline dehydrogenase